MVGGISQEGYKLRYGTNERRYLSESECNLRAVKLHTAQFNLDDGVLLISNKQEKVVHSKDQWIIMT